MFGAATDKDLDVVCRAFSDLEEWRILICGRVADLYRPEAHPCPTTEPIVIGGFVSNTTRELAYAAADLAILSFRTNYERNSGTLLDAIAWGVPVVCSENSAAAEIVHQYRLGVTFSPGDPESLVSAVRRAPARIEPEDLDRAREELSNRAVAHRHLKVLQEIGERNGS
jgi:glycosyltransferase involved in cell wall biosynthesis